MPNLIKNLEKLNITLIDAINKVKNVEVFKCNQNDKDIAILKKLQKVIQNNIGFSTLYMILKILNGR